MKSCRDHTTDRALILAGVHLEVRGGEGECIFLLAKALVPLEIYIIYVMYMYRVIHIGLYIICNVYV